MNKIINNQYDENTQISYKYKIISTNEDDLKILKEIIKEDPLKTLSVIKKELQEKI